MIHDSELRIEQKVDRAQEITGHVFKDRQLLVTALTHPSAVEGMPDTPSYERLEFLGDSVAGFIVARELYLKFPDLDEGMLTRLKVSLVSGASFSEIAGELGLGECIIFGNSETGTGSRGLASALENVYESIVGALLLDGGVTSAARFIKRTLGPHLVKDRALIPDNPKSVLQECTQRDHHETPSYRLVGQDGPAHDPTFTCEALVGDKPVGTGSGSSKKEAEAQAAMNALFNLGYVDENGRQVMHGKPSKSAGRPAAKSRRKDG